MKTRNLVRFALVLLSTLSHPLSTAHAQTTAFTYQGFLTDQGTPANGAYDLTFTVFNASSGGAPTGTSNVFDDLVITNGLFTVTLNPGAGVFDGNQRWLQIAVRPGASMGAYTEVTPRHKIEATPYAIHAAYAGDIEPGANVVFSGGSVTFATSTPFYLGPFATNLVMNLNAQYLAGKDAGQFWTLGGNSGQLASSYVLGTLDNNALELRVNGQRGLRIEPTTFGVNFIAGNSNNFIASNALISTIGGGALNTIEASAIGSTIAGGDINTIQGGAGESVIGGGVQNLIGSNSIRAVIAGGQFNRIGTNASNATIGGGRNNRITNNAPGGVISGGSTNVIEQASIWSVIGGGTSNLIQAMSEFSVIGGGSGNRIDSSSFASTIDGGSNNVIGASSPLATIGGGWDNTIGPASPYGGTIAGGYANRIDGTNFQAVIGGGAFNRIHTYGATSVIGGGEQNNVLPNATYSVIGGGLYNTISNNASYATIGGGLQNRAAGEYSTVPGGYYNRAGAAYSFAAGYEARALHEGSFVWSEPPTNLFQFDVGMASTASYQFAIRASGGIQVHPTTSLYFGNQARQMLNLWSNSYGIGVQDYTTYFRCANTGNGNDGFIWYRGGVHNDAYANAGGGTELMHLVPGGLYVNGAFIGASDRNLKENFKPVDARAVLDKVAALPLSEWNYKADTSSRHVGPMAQDFYAAFGVGPDDKHIATVDADGVALAAIQGLNQKVTEELKRRDAENAELRRELAELKRMLVKLSAKGN